MMVRSTSLRKEDEAAFMVVRLREIGSGLFLGAIRNLSERLVRGAAVCTRVWTSLNSWPFLLLAAQVG
jgi:hypothetical protein